MPTTSGWAASQQFFELCGISAAYLTRQNLNNIMDMLQLVFGFVNAPLFATFLLGMFWKRATGHGAFWGLLGGTLGAAIFNGLALSKEATVMGIKGELAGPALPQLSGQNSSPAQQ